MRCAQTVITILLTLAPSGLLADEDCKTSLTTASRMTEVLECYNETLANVEADVQSLKNENAKLLEIVKSFSASSVKRIVHMQRETTASDVDRKPIIWNGNVLKVADAFCVLSGVRGRFDGSPENFSVYTIDGVWHFTHKGGAAAIGGSIDCYAFNTISIQN